MPNRRWMYASALLTSACTTAMYSGPRRPPSELAILASDDSTISSIDGVQTPYSGGNFGKFEVLPGEHSVGVSLNRVVGGGVYTADRPYTLCMKAEAGREYRVRIDMVGSLWRPYMVDESSAALVSHPCGAVPPRPALRDVNRLLYEPLPVTPKK